ncbi:MAG: tRNA epoxyqueuosine(34) reductase QueG [Actinomycetota bacterium]
MPTPTIAELRALGLDAGLCAVGAASADPFDDVRVELERRREVGLSADMQFTFRNPARSTDPDRALPGASSLIVGAYDYQRTAPPMPTDVPVARVAAYSWEDHYAALREALEPIAEALRVAGHRATVIADQNHLVDRAAAHRAGIGWWGKSSNILIPGIGSLVVLGAVITDAAVEPDHDDPVADGCRTCTSCLDGCPTGAIIEPGVIDARRCLAWLVQAEGVFPVEYREALGDRIYGCDDCQDVCPPNKIRMRRPSPAGADEAWVDVLSVLNADDDELLARLGRWYIPNRDPDYLRRNALLVLANVADPTPAVVATVERYLAHPRSLLRAHAVWAARRLGIDVPDDLSTDDAVEVRNEIARA